MYKWLSKYGMMIHSGSCNSNLKHDLSIINIFQSKKSKLKFKPQMLSAWSLSFFFVGVWDLTFGMLQQFLADCLLNYSCSIICWFLNMLILGYFVRVCERFLILQHFAILQMNSFIDFKISFTKRIGFEFYPIFSQIFLY